MISSVTVRVSAAHPNAPLGPFYVIMGSAMSLTIVDVPRSLGKREITGIVVKAKNADGEERGIAAERVGSAWGATVSDDFFDRVGTISNGITVNAVGKDETGVEETWVLGSGQLIVLDDTGVITPEEKRYIVKWYTSIPANPVNGDACSVNGVPCIYTRGQWRPFGGGDMKHSEFTDLEAPENMTQKESNLLLAKIVRKLKGTAILLSYACCIPALAASAPLTPDTDHGDISPTNKLGEVVHAVVDGAARPLPRYLHTYDADDSYPDAAQEYYRSRGDGKVDGGCSAVRRGGFICRNFDFPFDDRAEFVVRMSASTKRFASVGVAQVGTNLTEAIVTSGKPSRWYKALPGATVDGINERGVVAEINVVDGDPSTSGWHTGGDIHPLAAVRWALDNGTSAHMVATNLAARIAFPAGWSQNFHWMIADATSTYIVENGSAHAVTNGVPVMTNFRLYPTRDTAGAGQERYDLLLSSACCITNAWYTRAYLRSTDWASEFHDAAEMEAAKEAWETHTREQLRGHGLWQSVHTSIFDLTNRTLRISVQETDDWYTVAVPVSSGIKVETDPTVPAWAKAANPPEGMTDNALVWTNNAVKTKGGAKTVVAGDVGALPSVDPYDQAASVYWNQIGFNVLHPFIFFDAALNVWAPNAKITSKAIIGNAPNGGLYLGSGIGDFDPYISIRHDNATGHDYISFLDGSEIRFADPLENLDERIARLAPAPGNYAAVSNAAMWASNTVAGIHIDHTDIHFSNEVLAVGLNIDTNSVAVLNEIAATFGGFPITGTATTVGGLLAALAAAVAWLRKNALTDGLETDGTPTDQKLHKFFKESNSLLTGVIDARLPYPLNTDGTIKDRAVNVVTSGAFVIPEGFKDLLIRYTGVPTSLTFSGTDASIADYGDDLPTETGDYLITVTRTKAAECYIRIIKLEARA